MTGRTIDIATVSGLVVGFGLLAIAIAIGGSFAAFVNLPSLAIVFGGTFAVTMISYSLREVIKAQVLLARTIVSHRVDPGAAAGFAMRLAEQARRDGVLNLQRQIREFREIPFLHKAMQLVIDGTSADDVEQILEREVHQMVARHRKGAGVFRKAAEVAPAMGLIGTLVGLVQMLSNLDDPANIGPAMAVALLTTFYGAILANMVFSPFAAKLERNSEEEALLNSVYAMTAASISRQENPRRLEMLLNTLLPPAERLALYD